jgi:hypothetical protein
MKLTDWIPGDVKPVRDGVYQRELHSFPRYALFVRGKWRSSHSSLLTAALEVQNSKYLRLPWRGLAEQPK